jgi:lysophospholipase L1-like esterase
VRLHRRVHWQAVGGFGWTAERLGDELRRHGTPPHDVALVTVGVNDVLALTPRAAWRRELGRIRERLFDAGARIQAYAGLPCVRELPGLSWPLTPLLDRRAAQLDRVLADFVAAPALPPERSLLHLPTPRADAPGRIARDGLHPSSSGYAWWAAALVEGLGRELRALPEPLPLRSADG